MKAVVVLLHKLQEHITVCMQLFVFNLVLYNRTQIVIIINGWNPYFCKSLNVVYLFIYCYFLKHKITKFTSNTYQTHQTHQIHIKHISNAYQIHQTHQIHQIHIKYISNTYQIHIKYRFLKAGDNSFFPKSPPGFFVAIIRNESFACCCDCWLLRK